MTFQDFKITMETVFADPQVAIYTNIHNLWNVAITEFAVGLHSIASMNH